MRIKIWRDFAGSHIKVTHSTQQFSVTYKCWDNGDKETTLYERKRKREELQDRLKFWQADLKASKKSRKNITDHETMAWVSVLKNTLSFHMPQSLVRRPGSLTMPPFFLLCLHNIASFSVLSKCLYILAICWVLCLTPVTMEYSKVWVHPAMNEQSGSGRDASKEPPVQ